MFTPAPCGFPEPFVMQSMSMFAVGDAILANGGVCTSAVWPSASLAFFFPFVLTTPRTYTVACWANGTVVSGNVDLGIYNLAGSRLLSIGSTAQSGTTANQKVTLGSSITLNAGRYYMAMVADNTTATYIKSLLQTPSERSAGMEQMASAFPLPSTATFANSNQSYVPLFGFSEVSWI